MFSLNYPHTKLTGILAFNLQMSTELDYNTPSVELLESYNANQQSSRSPVRNLTGLHAV